MAKFWYHERHKRTHPSASSILKLINSFYVFESVVDLGCGVGTWLFSAKELGVKTVQGFDGSDIDPNHLMIDTSEFRRFNLNGSFESKATYQLGISLEVAEHINPNSADEYIKLLTSLSPLILFSAAIPGQGGSGHINEQEPSYWIEKFNQQGFELFDIIRPQIWNRSEILPWYKQNCLLFIHKSLSPSLKLKLQNLENWNGVHLVHPDIFKMKVDDTRSPYKLLKTFAKIVLKK